MFGGKRSQKFQERIMNGPFAEVEPGTPLKTYDIAVRLNPDKIVPFGKIHLNLTRLVASGQLEIVELPEMAIHGRGEEIRVMGYQKPVTELESAH